MSVSLNCVSRISTFVEISGEGYTLSIQTTCGHPQELIDLAEKAELEAARFTRRAKRLREAANHLAVQPEHAK